MQRDKLRQYQKKACFHPCPHAIVWLINLSGQIQTILDREHAIAKTHLANGQKDRAIIALRRRKYQESLLVKTDGQLENLEQLVCTISPYN